MTAKPRTKPAARLASIEGLTKDYGNGPVLGPLDLVIGRNERISLIGHNGSGKSTLIRMLVGLLEASEGTATIGGHPAGSIEARAAVSYLGDAPVFYDDLSVWEHLEYVARLHGVDDWEPDAARLLDAMGLTDRRDDLPTTFSRGLRQRAAIAIAFVRPFELLVVDEPIVGLDRPGRDALLDLFREAHRGGAALLVATHELTTVGEADRLVALRDGQLVFDGTPGDAEPDELVTR